MTAVSSRTLHRVGDTRPSRIIRCVEFAKNVDRIARLQVAPLKGRIGIEHEIADRERADPVKDPHRDAFHQVSVPTPMICGSLRCIARPPVSALRETGELLGRERKKGHLFRSDVSRSRCHNLRKIRRAGRLTSASLIASSFWSIATYCPCQQARAAVL